MEPGDITRELLEIRDGRPEALDRLFTLVYQRLKALARRELRPSSRTPTLGATALVNEAYLRLVDQTRVDWKDRGHFFAVAARAMRQIAVDHARRRRAAKRGAGVRQITLDDEQAASDPALDEVLAVDEALERLAQTSPRLVQVVELCFFAGLTTEEAAEALEVGPATVKRDWRKAKALLFGLIRGGGSAGDAPRGG